MSLQSRLSALITAVGADIKAINTALAAKAPSASPTFTGEVIVSDVAGGKLTMIDTDAAANQKRSRWWNSAGSTYFYLMDDVGGTRLYPVRIYHADGRFDFDGAVPVPTHNDEPLAKLSDFDSVSAYILGTTTQGMLGDLTLRRVSFDAEEWDTDGRFDTTSTKGRWTPGKAGRWHVHASICFSSSPAVNTRVIGVLYKNGAQYKRIIFDYQAGVSDNDKIFDGSCLAVTANATDYFELFLQHNAGAGVTYNLRNNNDGCRFEGHYIGP